MNALPSNTAFELNPLDLKPRGDIAAIRKRLFSPRREPVKRVEAAEAPAIVYMEKTRRAAPTWREQPDAHVRAYLEWKGNPPLAFLKLRCRERGLDYAEIVGESKSKWLIDPRHSLMKEVKEAFGLNNVALGRLFNRDHSTIYAALNRSGPVMSEGERLAMEQTDRRIALLAERGLTQARICEITGLSHKRVRQSAHRLGIRFDRNETCADHVHEIREMYLSGMPMRAISLHFGLNRNAVSTYAKRHGWTR